MPFMDYYYNAIFAAIISVRIVVKKDRVTNTFNDDADFSPVGGESLYEQPGRKF